MGLELRHTIRSFPKLQVCRAPHHAACSRHVVHLCFLVGQNRRVAQANRIQRHVLSDAHIRFAMHVSAQAAANKQV